MPGGQQPWDPSSGVWIRSWLWSQPERWVYYWKVKVGGEWNSIKQEQVTGWKPEAATRTEDVPEAMPGKGLRQRWCQARVCARGGARWGSVPVAVPGEGLRQERCQVRLLASFPAIVDELHRCWLDRDKGTYTQFAVVLSTQVRARLHSTSHWSKCSLWSFLVAHWQCVLLPVQWNSTPSMARGMELLWLIVGSSTL